MKLLDLLIRSKTKFLILIRAKKSQKIVMISDKNTIMLSRYVFKNRSKYVGILIRDYLILDRMSENVHELFKLILKK